MPNGNGQAMKTQTKTQVRADVGVSRAASAAIALGSLAMVGGMLVAGMGLGIQTLAEQSARDNRIVRVR